MAAGSAFASARAGWPTSSSTARSARSRWATPLTAAWAYGSTTERPELLAASASRILDLFIEIRPALGHQVHHVPQRLDRTLLAGVLPGIGAGKHHLRRPEMANAFRRLLEDMGHRRELPVLEQRIEIPLERCAHRRKNVEVRPDALVRKGPRAFNGRLRDHGEIEAGSAEMVRRAVQLIEQPRTGGAWRFLAREVGKNTGRGLRPIVLRMARE